MLVSIVITSYNYGKYLARCVESCLAQDMPDGSFEVIVVDDCSTDETPSVLKSFDGIANFCHTRNERNLGVAGTANTGIRIARGQFVTRVDADDYVSPGFAGNLSTQLAAKPNAFGVACDYYHVDEEGNRLRYNSARTKPISCGIMYRKAELEDVGMYSADWRHREEEELRHRLADQYAIHYLDEALYHYVLHGENKTTQTEQMALYQQRLEDLYS